MQRLYSVFQTKQRMKLRKYLLQVIQSVITDRRLINGRFATSMSSIGTFLFSFNNLIFKCQTFCVVLLLDFFICVLIRCQSVILVLFLFLTHPIPVQCCRSDESKLQKNRLVIHMERGAEIKYQTFYFKWQIVSTVAIESQIFKEKFFFFLFRNKIKLCVFAMKNIWNI